MCFSPQRRAILRHPNSKKCFETDVLCTFSLPNVRIEPRAIFGHQNFKKCSETDVFCNCLLQNVVFATTSCNFFDIWTAKSPPAMRCFEHFHFQMRFSPQRRAIFAHRNFKKCADTVSFFSMFTSKCAFRHSGVQFSLSPLTTWLRTRRFNRPTFRLARHTNHWKNTAFRDFSNIWRGCIFFLLTFALVHLFTSDLTACHICFSTLHMSEVCYLNFLRIYRDVAIEKLWASRALKWLLQNSEKEIWNLINSKVQTHPLVDTVLILRWSHMLRKSGSKSCLNPWFIEILHYIYLKPR